VAEPARTSVIVTALGADKHGLLAAVATTVAAQNANVDDVSQTVTGGMFTMIMFVSFLDEETTLADLQAALARTGEETGLQITVQHEDIFRFMHRV
jgi:ACT domain-containing protein